MNLSYSVILFAVVISLTSCGGQTKQHPDACYIPPEINIEEPDEGPLPWVDVYLDGTIIVVGVPCTIEEIKPRLKEFLSTVDNPPTEIPPIFEEGILMGTRHEIETRVYEALFEINNKDAISNVLHGFFNWYLDSETIIPEFTTYKNERVYLDETNLEIYLNILENTDALASDFSQRTKSRYIECAKLWAEYPEGPYDCLDADPFTCSQDAPELIKEFFTSAPVQISYLDNEAVIATLVDDAGYGAEFEMIKENDKWRIAKFPCDE